MKQRRKKTAAGPVKSKVPRRTVARSGSTRRTAARAFTAPATLSSLNSIPWDRELDDVNVPGLNRPATNAVERRISLDHAVNNLWINEDISAIRRIESGGRFLWIMWRRSTLPPA